MWQWTEHGSVKCGFQVETVIARAGDNFRRERGKINVVSK
jgi:hypothetical protein